MTVSKAQYRGSMVRYNYPQCGPPWPILTSSIIWYQCKHWKGNIRLQRCGGMLTASSRRIKETSTRVIHCMAMTRHYWLHLTYLALCFTLFLFLVINTAWHHYMTDADPSYLWHQKRFQHKTLLFSVTNVST